MEISAIDASGSADRESVHCSEDGENNLCHKEHRGGETLTDKKLCRASYQVSPEQGQA